MINLQNLIECRNLSVGHSKNKPILENINFQVELGKNYLLKGRNGSGKTSFLQTISGILPKISGEIHSSPLTKISMVTQFHQIQLHAPITVKSFLKLSILSQKFFSFRKYSFSNFEKSILEELEIFSFQDLLLRECSGGQLQKVLIARSLLIQPSLLILDEPFDHLDSHSIKNTIQLLKEHSSENQLTILLVSHNGVYDSSLKFHSEFRIEGSQILNHG